MPNFPFYQQLDQMDCGPTCLRMIAKHYGLSLNIQRLLVERAFHLVLGLLKIINQ
jgi:ABC-type bacteriocin/lantibiotic exporter with double-glycine peptidase domain